MFFMRFAPNYFLIEIIKNLKSILKGGFTQKNSNSFIPLSLQCDPSLEKIICPSKRLKNLYELIWDHTVARTDITWHYCLFASRWKLMVLLNRPRESVRTCSSFCYDDSHLNAPHAEWLFQWDRNQDRVGHEFPWIQNGH